MNRIPFPQLWRDSEKVLEVVCEGLTLNTSAYSLNEDVMGDLLIWGKQGRDKSSVSCSTKQLHILVITKKTNNADFPSLSWPSLLHVANGGNIFMKNLFVVGKYIFCRGKRPHLCLQQCTRPRIQKCPAMCTSAQRMRRDFSLRWEIIKWFFIIIFKGVLVMLCQMQFQSNVYRFSVVHLQSPCKI